MNRKKSFSLLEVLVASVILVIVMAGAGATFMAVKQISRDFGYRYTAIDLAKEVLEYAEANIIYTTHVDQDHHLKYYYDSSQGKYRVMEGTSSYDPFHYLGDINDSRQLVPKSAPQSVAIDFRSKTDHTYSTDGYQGYWIMRATVVVTWKEKPAGETKKVEMSVIPVTQVNNQLTLAIRAFSWN
ncbi:MAG: prepilin-type N-terminal cleavage/methylation domain-containing protein [Candidatus Omnitrophota bacterium]